MKRTVWVVTVLWFFCALNGFAQEQKSRISAWGFGLETSFGVTSGSGLPKNYSVSLQGLHDIGSGLSLDYIKAADDEYSHGLFVNSGLLGSAFLGIPLSKFFIPYIGGGLGVKFNGLDDALGFAWKVDTGAAAWLSNIFYVKTGISYDNIRQGLGISVGVGFKLTKSVTTTYRNYNGTTFQRTFTKFLLNNNSTPNAVYVDTFVSSEVVGTYQNTTTSSVYTAAQYEFVNSDGSPGNSIFKDKTLVQTKKSTYTTYYYVYNVTVTRNWYTRTWYYKDRDPTTQKVYQDTESAVLVNKFS